MTRQLAILSFFVGLALLTLGCAGPSECPVRGKVAFNGDPVADGDILFLPEEGKTRPGAGKIIDGEYDCEMIPGRYRVEIRASRQIPGASVAGMGNAPVFEEYIPARYNTTTELRAEVKAGAENQFDFKLADGKNRRSAVGRR